MAIEVRPEAVSRRFGLAAQAGAKGTRVAAAGGSTFQTRRETMMRDAQPNPHELPPPRLLQRTHCYPQDTARCNVVASISLCLQLLPFLSYLFLCLLLHYLARIDCLLLRLLLHLLNTLLVVLHSPNRPPALPDRSSEPWLSSIQPRGNESCASSQSHYSLISSVMFTSALSPCQ